MKPKVILFTVLMLLGVVSAGYPYWIWTPESGKWVNPKTAVKPTPSDQFAFAKSLFDAGSHDEAEREFKKLLKTYPKAFEAAESEYYLALIAEKRGRPYEAFKAYQRVIDKYPFSERIQEIVASQYRIAEGYMQGRRTGDVPVSVVSPAIEIFSKVIENSSYGALAPKAQYQIGLAFKGLQQYYEAEEAFNKVISNYPESDWVPAAQYQLAETRSRMSKGAAYDQAAMQEAKQKFEEFIEEYPEAELSKDAERNLERLNRQEAQANFEIGRFYEKQKADDAARVYYNEVIAKYPDSLWAVRARERLMMMEKKTK